MSQPELELLMDTLKAQKPFTQRLEQEQFHTIKFERDEHGFVLNDMHFSNAGFLRFCQAIGIPHAYVSTLPTDNVRKDILATLLSSELRFLTLLVKNSNRIIGVTKQEHTAFAIEVLPHVFALNKDNKIRKINAGPDSCHIYFIRDEEIPLPDDSHELGICISMDDSLGNYPKLSHYVNRVVCSNGLVVRRLAPLAKFSQRLPQGRMINQLETKIDDQFGLINTKYVLAVQEMNSRKLTPVEYELIRRFLGRKLRWEAVPDAEGSFDKQVSKTSSFYDVMNYVSDFAKIYPSNLNHDIMLMAGELVENFAGSIPEYFKGYADFARREIEHDASLSSLN